MPGPGRWSSGGVERKTVRVEKRCVEVKGMKRNTGKLQSMFADIKMTEPGKEKAL